MASSVYRLFAWAIENHVPMACNYDDAPREICPVILGHNKDGEEVVLVWQTAGRTSKGPLRRPDWKCLILNKMTGAELRGGDWMVGSRHQQAQVCVKKVDYDANCASPYHPTRSLGGLRGNPSPVRV